jgi:hypothetical protein
MPRIKSEDPLLFRSGNMVTKDESNETNHVQSST